MAMITRATGRLGCRYVVERLLQDRPGLGGHGRVYLATADDQSFVLKSVQQDEFATYNTMFAALRNSNARHVRLPVDDVPDHSMFAYKFFRGHLLEFAGKDVPGNIMKRVLRDSLRCIAELHDNGIVHTDIKPNNIMLNWREGERNAHGTPAYTLVDQVQIADLESAIELSEDQCFSGVRVGNPMWCSPEALAACSTKGEDFEELDIHATILQRHLSYFAERSDDVCSLVRYMEENDFAPIIQTLEEAFGVEYPRLPFRSWPLKSGGDSAFIRTYIRVIRPAKNKAVPYTGRYRTYPLLHPYPFRN